MGKTLKEHSSLLITLLLILLSVPFLNIFFFKVDWISCLKLSLLPMLVTLLGISFSTFLKIPFAWCKTVAMVAFLFAVLLFSFLPLPVLHPLFILGIFSLFLFLALAKRALWKFKLTEILIVEIVSYLVFFSFLILRSFFSDIAFAEKPMDFSIMMKVMTSLSLPLQDPWASKETLGYYYHGYLMFALLPKMLGLQPALAYAGIVALVASLTASVVGSFSSMVIRNIWVGLYTGFLFIWLSNMKAVWNLMYRFLDLDISFFWQSTRVFEHGHFAEFPSWSLIHGDLHPHLLALPFTMTLLLLVMRTFIKNRFDRKEGMISGALLGALVGINGWDFVFFAPLIVVLVLLSIVKAKKGFASAIYFFVMSLLSFFLLKHYMGATLTPTLGIHQLSHSLLSYFNHIGHLVFVIILILAAYFMKNFKIKWKLFCFNPLVIPVAVLMLYAFVVVIFQENFYLMDPMNTLFKFQTNIYILLLIVLISISSFMTKKIRPYVMGALLLLEFGTFAHLYVQMKNNPFMMTRPSLNGEAYLEKKYPFEWRVIEHLRLIKPPKDASIAELYGPSFDFNSNIVSTFSGVSSVLGWEGHVRLRGVSDDVIRAKKQLLVSLYLGKSLDEKSLPTYLLIGQNECLRFPALSLVESFSSYKKEGPTSLTLPCLKFLKKD